MAVYATASGATVTSRRLDRQVTQPAHHLSEFYIRISHRSRSWTPPRRVPRHRRAPRRRRGQCRVRGVRRKRRKVYQQTPAFTVYVENRI